MMPTQSADLHPRPQLTRARWTALNGAWSFAFDDQDVGWRENWVNRPEVFDRTIQVPFPFESELSGVHENGFHPVVWYRRGFSVPQEDRAGRLLLHFGAVDYRAEVWVNGLSVARHEGGHTPFTADITAALVDGGEQIVVVRAEDDPHDLAQPRGKQDWEKEPHEIWYERTSGIWQSVWLEPVALTYVQSLRWTPDLDRGMLGLKLRLNATPTRPLRLKVRLSLRGTLLAEDTYEIERQELRRDIALEPHGFAMGRKQVLWSPRRPNLIDAQLTLLSGDEVVDELGSYAGLRSVGVQNGRFLLNGSPYYLRLVLAQNYWPESHLAAPSDEALRREVELVKELGFNGVRIHQKIEDPRFLYWCDKLGVLVWGEAANAYVFTEEAQLRLTREWLEALERDYNHPCIVAWVPLNESWGVPNLERDPAQRDFVKALYHLTKSLDATRPAIGNDGWQHVAGDILGIHDYAVDGSALRARYATSEAVARTFAEVQPLYRNLLTGGHTRGDEAVMITEFGGISFVPEGGERWWGYGTVSGEEAFLAKYEELVSAILDSEAVVGFCYTQLTDTLQESNGLLTAERVPKVDIAKLRAINTGLAKSVPGDVINELQLASEITPLQSAD